MRPRRATPPRARSFLRYHLGGLGAEFTRSPGRHSPDPPRQRSRTVCCRPSARVSRHARAPGASATATGLDRQATVVVAASSPNPKSQISSQVQGGWVSAITHIPTLPRGSTTATSDRRCHAVFGIRRRLDATLSPYGHLVVWPPPRRFAATTSPRCHHVVSPPPRRFAATMSLRCHHVVLPPPRRLAATASSRRHRVVSLPPRPLAATASSRCHRVVSLPPRRLAATASSCCRVLVFFWGGRSRAPPCPSHHTALLFPLRAACDDSPNTATLGSQVLPIFAHLQPQRMPFIRLATAYCA